MHSQQADEQSRAAKRSDRGQTLVEFAMVISILFLFILGIFEFSRLFFAFGTMSHGVREAARYAVVNPGASEVEQVAEDRIFLIGGTATITVTYVPDPADPYDLYCSHRCMVQVEATSTYQPWTPLIPSFEMFARSTLHIE
jgi:Flp pilus assembly protein TadG